MIKLLNKLSTIIVDQVNNQVSSYQDLFTLPRQCLLCRTTIYEKNICLCCKQRFLRLEKRCEVCYWPLMAHMTRCSICINQKIKHKNIFTDHTADNHFTWSDVTIAFGYTHPIDKIIQQFKYLGDLTKGRLLADLFLEYFQHSLLKVNDVSRLPEVIIPVPLYKAKLKQRGFNQTVEIARYLSRKLDIPIDMSLVAKFCPSDPQMGLDKQSRVLNLENTFCLNKKVKYKSAVIIDDVVTTGSTAEAIAKLLRKTHVKNISLWALARRC